MELHIKYRRDICYVRVNAVESAQTAIAERDLCGRPVVGVDMQNREGDEYCPGHHRRVAKVRCNLHAKDLRIIARSVSSTKCVTTSAERRGYQYLPY